MSYRNIISCHVMSCHISDHVHTSCPTLLCHVMSHFLSCHDTSCRVISFYSYHMSRIITILRSGIADHVAAVHVPRLIIPCHVISYHTILYYYYYYTHTDTHAYITMPLHGPVQGLTRGGGLPSGVHGRLHRGMRTRAAAPMPRHAARCGPHPCSAFFSYAIRCCHHPVHDMLRCYCMPRCTTLLHFAIPRG